MKIVKSSISLLSDSQPELEKIVTSGETYGLRRKEEQDKVQCKAPDAVPSQDELELPEGTDVEDENSVFDEAEKKRLPVLSEEHQNLDCNLEYIIHRVGTLYQIPEYKVAWVVKPIKVGKCTIVKTKVPKFQTRTRKRALYVAAATEESIKAKFGDDILECLVIAATSVGLLALVTGGVSLSVAIKSFGSAFTYCMREKIKAIGRCLVPDIFLATEIGEWQDL